MATINDFKLVNKYSREYYKNIETNKKIDVEEHTRLGFYLLALECITGEINVDELQDSIIDTEFCSLVYDENNNDLGIDAVHIDDENKTIKLFNFKFRESFKEQKAQNEKNILDTLKFFMKLNNKSFSEMDKRTAEKAKEITERFDSDDIWKMELFLVSNDNLRLQDNNSTLKDYKELYGMSIKTIVLDDIVSYVSKRPEDLNSKFIIESNSVLTYEENNLASQKSYLVKLPLSTLVRITCDNLEMRINESLSDLSKLEDLKLELGFLYDNVRGYLGETKFNKNIMKTLDEKPSKFFMFNNGVTITARNIIMKPINGNKKYSCKIEGFQIVNGGQTLRSIYEFKDRNFNEENLANAEVLVRLFKTEFDEELTNDIAEFTNSQNAISSNDLKSISNIQVQIEKYLETEGIDYIRKSGDVKSKQKKFTSRISMDRLAQIIYSYKGYPDRATNQKSKLFDIYYDEVFDSKEVDFELYVKLIRYYEEVVMEYSKSKYNNYNQKYLYVIYLWNRFPESKINEFIDIIEEALKDYKIDEDISEARKLIQKGYKEILDKKTKDKFNKK